VPTRHVRALTIVAAVIGAAAPAHVQDITPEYQLKAAFVARFAEFTEWPPAAHENRGVIDVCVARPDPFGGVLARLLEGVVILDRPLAARQVADAGDLGMCHVLFIPRQSAIPAPALLSQIASSPVLTVGETPTFLDEGGILTLAIVNGRVRFEVNTAAANRAGLRLSAQLLRLAVNLRGGTS
jgi:hypothetical protein